MTKSQLMSSHSKTKVLHKQNYELVLSSSRIARFFRYRLTKALNKNWKAWQTVIGRTRYNLQVELSVETKLVPSNHEGTVADSPGTVSPATGEEEPESVDENPNFIGEEGGVIVLKFENENGEAAFCLSILFSYFWH